MKSTEYTFGLTELTIGKKRVMVEGLPRSITWNDIQDVAGLVVKAVRIHTGHQHRLSEIRIKPDGIVFFGADKKWTCVYGKA